MEHCVGPREVRRAVEPLQCNKRRKMKDLITLKTEKAVYHYMVVKVKGEAVLYSSPL